MSLKEEVKARMDGEAPKVRAIRRIVVPPDNGFQRLIVEARIPISGDIAADLQLLRSQLDRIIEDLRKNRALENSKRREKKAGISGSAAPDGWRPWRDGRGESKPAEADPKLAQFLESKGYGFRNRWASKDGYEYWLSKLESGAKYIQRSRRSPTRSSGS
ncbi:MAG: hypothetical protein ACP5QI_08780 [Candidatus Bathyarchaeia archaeon]